MHEIQGELFLCGFMKTKYCSMFAFKMVKLHAASSFRVEVKQTNCSFFRCLIPLVYEISEKTSYVQH